MYHHMRYNNATPKETAAEATTMYVAKPCTLIWTRHNQSAHTDNRDYTTRVGVPMQWTDQFWRWQLWQVCWHRNEFGWPGFHRTGCASCAGLGCRGCRPGGGASLSQEHSHLCTWAEHKKHGMLILPRNIRLSTYVTCECKHNVYV